MDLKFIQPEFIFWF